MHMVVKGRLDRSSLRARDGGTRVPKPGGQEVTLGTSHHSISSTSLPLRSSRTSWRHRSW